MLVGFLDQRFLGVFSDRIDFSLVERRAIWVEDVVEPNLWL